MAERSQRTKLVLSDLGEPAIIKTRPESERSYVLGTLIGTATKFVERKSLKQNADGSQDIFEGLGGSFRSIPSDPEKAELESGVLFIPDAFHNVIANVLRPLIKEDGNGKVDFMFEVSTIRAKNPAGYSWDFRPMISIAAANPLDALIARAGELKLVEGKRMLAIAPPEKPASAKK